MSAPWTVCLWLLHRYLALLDLLVGRMDLTVLRRGHAMSFNRKHIQLDGTQTFINLGALRAIFVLLPFSETALQQKACAILLRSFACSDRKGVLAISSPCASTADDTKRLLCTCAFAA